MHEIVDTSSPTFNEERRKGIGASEIAQACNLSSYGSAFELWERKTGRAEPVATTIAMEIGNLLEGFLIEVFCREMAKAGQHWVEKGSYQQAKFRDKEHDWLWATLDTVVMCEGELCPLECKTTTSRNKALTADAIPTEWFCQSQIQMHVLGAKRAFFSILVDKTWQWREVQYDEKVAKTLINKAQEFWHHVQNDIVPPASWAHSEELDNRLALLPASADVIHADDYPLQEALMDDVTDYEDLGRQIGNLEKKREEIRVSLLRHLGDKSSGLLLDGRMLKVTKTARREYVVPAKDVVSLRIGKVK